MLDDRSYMRGPAFDARRSATMVLLVTLVAVFIVETLVNVFGGWGDHAIPALFGLNLQGIRDREVWRLLTFQFLHTWPWPLHLIFNCIGLYFFGRSVEEAIGTRNFLKLYFICGFFGGALQILVTWVFHQPDATVVGASAGVMGLLAAFSRLFPMREVTFFFYFFPVTLRARYLLWISLGYSVFGTLVRFDGVAHAAHLGGLIVGLLFVRWTELQQPLFQNPFKSRQRKRQLVQAASKSVRWRPRPTVQADVPSDEFISREVDPILDKISAHGIHSLTPREKEILEAARAKMSKR